MKYNSYNKDNQTKNKNKERINNIKHENNKKYKKIKFKENKIDNTYTKKETNKVIKKN